ncbi:MAG: putative serine/threonine-protein kinase iks1 [Chaenotheca gracillima]|nr:MAG: putative serine/threonine-protein kinase iks1 [Chaenotheca gracillima]
MASTSSPGAGAQAGESFTTMNKGDVEAIGSYCQYPYCHQLDFLPFKCESCRGTYCLDHRTETGHECPKAGAWAAARRAKNNSTTTTATTQQRNSSPAPPTSTCADPKCKTIINTPLNLGIHCTTCNRHYCLKHRLQEAHACNTLTPIGARPAAPAGLQTDKAKLALSRLKKWGAAKQSSFLSSTSSSSPKQSSARPSPAVSLATLKRTAKGDASIPATSRIYLHVEASADTTTAKYPSGAFFYNTAWSVGRVLDAAAKALQVENVNNRGGGEEDRLRVFHVEGGRLLGFGEKLGSCTVSGNTIVLLRGVGEGS